MKKISKKVLAVVLAMTMVFAMMAVSTAAAGGKTVEIKVIWTDAAAEAMGAYVCEGDSGSWGAISASWPGDSMKGNGAGTFTIKYDNITATKLNIIPNCSKGQTVNLEGISTATGYITITVGAAGSDGKFAATISTDAPVTDTGSGVADYSGVYAVVAIAAIAVVGFSFRRKTVTE